MSFVCFWCPWVGYERRELRHGSAQERQAKRNKQSEWFHFLRSLRLAFLSWRVSCLWVGGYGLHRSHGQQAQREDEPPRKERKEQEEISGNGNEINQMSLID